VRRDAVLLRRALHREPVPFRRLNPRALHLQRVAVPLQQVVVGRVGVALRAAVREGELGELLYFAHQVVVGEPGVHKGHRPVDLHRRCCHF